MKLKLSILFLFLALLAALAIKPFIPVRDVSVHVSAAPHKIHVGDLVEYTVTVRSPAGAEIKFPEISGNLGDFKIQSDETIVKKFASNKTVSRKFEITIYRPGRYRIPEMTVYYRFTGDVAWRSAGVNAEFISVKPVVTINLEAERRIKIGGGGLSGEVKGYDPAEGGASGSMQGRFIEAPIRYFIHEVPSPRKALTYKDMAIRGGLILAGAVVVIFVIIVIGGIVLYKKEPRPPDPALVALKGLRELKSSDKSVRDFYFEISKIVIRYLRGRFALSSQEMPIEDLVREVSRIKDIDEEVKEQLIERLRAYDINKYSEISSCEKDMMLALKAEEAFIEKTRKKESENDV